MIDQVDKTIEIVSRPCGYFPETATGLLKKLERLIEAEDISSSEYPEIRIRSNGAEVTTLFYTLDDYDDYGWGLCTDPILCDEDTNGDIDLEDDGTEVEDFKPWKKWMEPYINYPVSLRNLLFVLRHTLFPEVGTLIDGDQADVDNFLMTDDNYGLTYDKENKIINITELEEVRPDKDDSEE